MTTPATKNLQRLISLRWIAILSQSAVILVVMFWIGVSLPFAAVISIELALLMINLASIWRLQQSWPVTELELFGQLVLDVLALTFLLYLTGGSTNPFVSVYLLTLSIAATLFARTYVWTLTSVTVVAYTLLLFFYIPLPGAEVATPSTLLFPEHNHTPSAHADHNSFSLHVWGMWFNFVVSAGLIAFFVQRIALSLRERERELALIREESLRNERILALGTLAAGTAHELGTPLATIAVITAELADEFSNEPDIAPQLKVVREQIDRCKQVLNKLVTTAASPGGILTSTNNPLVDYVADLLEQWQIIRPSVCYRLTNRCQQLTLYLRTDATLSQALINLLNNAADVCAAEIEILIRQQDNYCVMQILDQGPGLSAEMLQHAGKAFFTTTTTAHGMGIGLLLANATIERFGGRVQLFNRQAGGACTEIILPISTEH
jgi:two-component system sensor histidine kinase RegB